MRIPAGISFFLRLCESRGKSAKRFNETQRFSETRRIVDVATRKEDDPGSMLRSINLFEWPNRDLIATNRD